MKDWLIAHRGVHLESKENTSKAFKDAFKYSLPWIELDVHTTSDGMVICHHDFFINDADIATKTLQELKTLDPQLITLKEAVKVIGPVSIIVEIKATNTAKNVISILKKSPNWRVSSFKIEVIQELIDLGIDKKNLFLLQHYHSFRLIRKAKKLGIGGIGVNQRLMTPRLYRRAIYKGLSMYTYVVNSKWQAKLFRLLYPDLLICTDRPDQLQSLK